MLKKGWTALTAKMLKQHRHVNYCARFTDWIYWEVTPIIQHDLFFKVWELILILTYRPSSTVYVHITVHINTVWIGDRINSVLAAISDTRQKYIVTIFRDYWNTRYTVPYIISITITSALSVSLITSCVGTASKALFSRKPVIGTLISSATIYIYVYLIGLWT